MDEEGNYYNYSFETAAVSDAAEFYGPPAPTQEQLGAAIVAESQAAYQEALGRQIVATSMGSYQELLGRSIVAAAGAALNSPTVRTVTTSPAYRTGAAILSGVQARPVATVTTSFDWKEALIGVAVLAGVVVVARAL